VAYTPPPSNAVNFRQLAPPYVVPGHNAVNFPYFTSVAVLAAAEGGSDGFHGHAFHSITALAATEATDVFAGTAKNIVHAILAATEATDTLAGIAKNLAHGTFAGVEAGADIFAGNSAHTFHASMAVSEAGADTFAASAHGIANCVLRVTELIDHFAAVSTHAVHSYANLAEAPDVLAGTARLTEHCVLHATEPAGDRFFCYTSGVFPLHAARGFAAVLTERSYNVKIL